MRLTMLDRTQVETYVEPLIDVLYSHLDAHRQLAEILEEKEQAFLKLELDALDDIIERERAVINRIAKFEEDRLELTGTLGSLLEYEEPASIRLSAIVPYVSTEIADTLIEVRDELYNLGIRIDRVKDRNRTLVSTSLDHIHLFLSVLSGMDNEATSYSPQGAATQDARPAVLDRRF